MSVRIPISADAGAVAEAIGRIRNAMRDAGQEGKAFADIDFSHPELAGMASDIAKVNAQLQDLQRIGRGDNAAGVRAIKPTDVLDWHDRMGTRYIDPGDAARHSAIVGGHILAGTQFAPAPPPVAPPPGRYPPAAPAAPAPPPTGKDSTPSLSGIIDSFGPMVKAGLGMLGVETVAKVVDRVTAQATDEATGTDSLMRHMSGSGTDFIELRDAVKETAEALHITIGETQRLSASWGRLTGSVDQTDILGNAKFSAGVARGYGIDPGIMTTALGRAANAGEDPRRMAMLMGETAREGGMQGKTEQVLQTLVQWTETQSRLLVDHSNVTQFADAYAFLNRTGEPGLKGDNATGILNSIDGAVRNGAGGDAGMALTLRAFAKRGITNPYQIQHILEGGMFERGPDGITNIASLKGEFDIEAAGADKYQRMSEGALKFNLNTYQFDAFDKHWRNVDVEKGANFLKSANIDLKSLDPKAFANIGDALGSDENGLEGWRKKLIARGDTAGDMADAKDLHGDALREAIVRSLGKHGMENTPGSASSDASADFSNRLTEIGRPMVEAMTLLKETTTAASGGLAALSIEFSSAAEMFRTIANGRFDSTGNPVPGTGDRSSMGMSPNGMTEQETAAYLKSKGVGAVQASAIIARMSLESGGDPGQETLDSDHKLHYGVMSWSPERQANFKKWSGGTDMHGSTEQRQLDFLLYEMTKGEEASNSAAFWGAQTAGEAGSHLSTDVIRPHDTANEAATTRDTANGYFKRLYGSPIPGGVKPGQEVLMGGGDVNHTFDPLTIHVRAPDGSVQTTRWPVKDGQPVPYGSWP